MLGAVIGDIIGSVYEFNNYKAKGFHPFFHPKAFFTDDTVCTVAVADALLNQHDPATALRDWCRRYWHIGGWGLRYADWVKSNSMGPYNSMGNGAAMRVSPAGFMANSIDEAIELAHRVTQVTHNHPEGLKGAAVKLENKHFQQLDLFIETSEQIAAIKEKRYQAESEAIRSRFEEYRQWIHETMNTEDQPYIQIVAAIVNQ